jgi:hypothetical protein
MEKKIGSIILATDQGLGYLAKDFFDHGIINKVLIHEHSSRTNHREWYPRQSIVHSREELLGCDALIFFEEVFDWKIIPEARQKGVKTILMPMYECTRSPLPYFPDLIITPSELDQKYYPQGTRINVPVEVKWKRRTKARVFVHNAGNGGLGGRNGTAELLKAIPLVKSPAKFIIRSQAGGVVCDDPRVEVVNESVPKEKLWAEGDVFIYPEKFNGLSLPMQEAFAAGMVVMCGDRFPVNTWLPEEPMIPISGYKKERIATEFDSAIYTPEAIAQTIDKWYNSDIERFSLMGKIWAEQNSWAKLKDKYLKLCEK